MTITKDALGSWIVEALEHFGGSAALIDICTHVWEHHETDLKRSGELRWSANQLRRSGVMRSATQSPRGVWELNR
jgi:hypothetical protein